MLPQVIHLVVEHRAPVPVLEADRHALPVAALVHRQPSCPLGVFQGEAADGGEDVRPRAGTPALFIQQAGEGAEVAQCDEVPFLGFGKELQGQVARRRV